MRAHTLPRLLGALLLSSCTPSSSDSVGIVVTGVVLLGIFLVLRSVLRSEVAGRAARQQLLATGLSVRGELTSVRESEVRGDPRHGASLNLELRVQLPNGREVDLSRRSEKVPLHKLSAVTVGAELPLRLDPDDQERWAIDWERV